MMMMMMMMISDKITTSCIIDWRSECKTLNVQNCTVSGDMQKAGLVKT